MQQDRPDTRQVPWLDVPAPAVARHPDLIIRPAELRNWIAELPLADPVHLAGLLHRQLLLLVRDPEPTHHYPALLATFHAPLARLQDQVWDDLVHPARRRKSALALQTAVARLLLEIGYGHMRHANLRIAAGQQPQAIDLVHATVAGAHLIQWDILQYNLTRPSVWRQLLQLYGIAELYGISSVSVGCALCMPFDAPDLHTNFHSTLALLLSDPYRLPRESLNRLIVTIGSFAQHLRIVPEPLGQGNIPVNLSGEVPPLRMARQPPNAQSRDFLQIDTFVQQLRTGKLPDERQALGEWLAESLESLVGNETTAESRRQPRHPRQADYHYQVGLRAVHHRLRDIHTGQAQSATQQFDGIEVDDGFITDTVDLGIPCRQMDHSLEGAGFILPAQVAVPEVGEMILFEADLRSKQLSGMGFVARVKRQLQRDDGSHEIGVEKLRGSIVPVGIGIARTPALLNAGRDREQLQLIAPAGSFAPDAEHTLHGIGRDYLVRYEELLEQGRLQRIRVSIVDPAD